MTHGMTSATVSPGYAPQAAECTGNETQEVVVPMGRECMLASEKALSALWLTPEEDVAWKEL